MSSDKPINAMYGGKVKLDLDKLKNNRKSDEEKSKPVVEVEETITKEPVQEVPNEEVVIESAKEDVIENEVVEEPTDDVKEESSNDECDISDDLKSQLEEKDEKLANQSNELHYLTNNIIPNLKKENSKLKSLKLELTDALEKSTRNYYDQLDINADLSDKIGKLGAEGAVNKVRADKLESELKTIKDDLQAKIDQYKEKLDSIDVEGLKKENSDLFDELSDIKSKLEAAKKENTSLSDEVKTLRNELIEIGNYKDEVDSQNKKEIDGYKEEISSLKNQLRLKESSFDKLSNESNKAIADLKNQVAELEEALEKESNKGLLSRFK